MDVGIGTFLQSPDAQVQEALKHMQKLHEKLHEMLQKGTINNMGNVTAVHKHLEVVDMSFDTNDQTLLMSAVGFVVPRLRGKGPRYSQTIQRMCRGQSLPFKTEWGPKVGISHCCRAQKPMGIWVDVESIDQCH